MSSATADDFVGFLRKEASMDYKTRQQLASAKKMHNVPAPGPRDTTNRFGQYGGYDWSGYNPTADTSAPKDLSGRGGYKSLAGGWEPDRYMGEINSARQRMIDNKYGEPDNDAYLNSLGVRKIQQPPAPGASYPAPATAAGGSLGGQTQPAQTYPQPGTPEYQAAVTRQARGSDDYRAARNGQGRMGFLPDGSWGLVTPEMEGQPIARTQPQTQPQYGAAPTPPPVAPPVMASPTYPDPFEEPPAYNQRTRPNIQPLDLANRTTGPNQFTNVPPSPAGFSSVAPDLTGMTTGPGQYNNVPPDPFSTPAFDPFESQPDSREFMQQAFQDPAFIDLMMKLLPQMMAQR